ncbi:MAG: M42 family metallopeptidase [Trueperaceae bacterium]
MSQIKYAQLKYICVHIVSFVIIVCLLPRRSQQVSSSRRPPPAANRAAPEIEENPVQQQPLTSEALADFEQLTQIPGLAGHEQRVAAFMTKRMQPLAHHTHTDTLGNVIATIEGTDPNAPTIMLFAHMDSLGFIVRKIDDNGYIKVHRLGGIPEKVLPATPVTITTSTGQDIQGIIGIKAHHVTPPEEKYTVTPLQELFIDIGSQNKQQTQNTGIQTGDPITYTGQFKQLTNNKITATFIDNRSGCLTLLETLKNLHKNPPKATTHIVATVQEEFNLRGAAPAAHNLKPNIAICLDGSAGADTPDLQEMSDVALGLGPMMNLYSFHGRGTLNGLMPHPALVRAFTRVARENDLPLQRNVSFGGLTDASYVQLENGGTPAIDLGIPRRYLHSPTEVCDLRDIAGLVALVTTFIQEVGADFDFSR